MSAARDRTLTARFATRSLEQTTLIAAATAVTATLYGGFFAGWSFLPRLIAMAVVAAALAAVLAAFRIRALLSMIACAVGFAVTALVVVVLGTGAAHDGSSDVLRIGWRALTGGWASMLSIAAPAPDSPQMLMTPALVTWLAGFLSVTVALRTRSVLGPSAILVGALAVGLMFASNETATHLIQTCAFLALIIALTLTRADVPASHGPHSLLRAAGTRTAFVAAIAGVGLMAAMVTEPLGAAQRFNPRVLLTTPLHLERAPDPLSAVREQRRLAAPQPLFTVAITGDAAPSLIATVTLKDFDGSRWTSPDTFRVAGPVLAPGPALTNTATLTEHVTLRALTGPYLPVLGRATQIDASLGSSALIGFDTDSGTLVADDAGFAGGSYTVIAKVPVVGASAASAAVGSGASFEPYLRLPAVPPQLMALAAQVTGGARTPFAELTALSDYLRSLPVNVDAQAGDSYGTLLRLLTATTPQGEAGYADQHAAAFAILARIERIPTRVVIGFRLPAPDAQTGGSRTFTITTADSYAWAQAYFQGYGWIDFDPTNTNNAVALPSNGPAPPQSAAAAPSATESASAAPTPTPSASQPSSPKATPFVVGGPGGAGRSVPLSWTLSVLVVLLIACAAIAVATAIRRLMRRARRGRGVPGRAGGRRVAGGGRSARRCRRGDRHVADRTGIRGPSRPVSGAHATDARTASAGSRRAVSQRARDQGHRCSVRRRAAVRCRCPRRVDTRTRDKQGAVSRSPHALPHGSLDDSAASASGTGEAAMKATAMRRPFRLLLPPRWGGVAIAGIAIVAVIAGMLAFGAHDAYPTTRVEQPSGLAWVTSDQIGSLTLLDGVAGQPVVNVPVTRTNGDALSAGQSGATGFALDQATRQLTRIDGSTYAPTAAQNPPTGTGNGADTELLVGARTAYVVDGGASTVSIYDPATLRLLSGPTAFAERASRYAAVVDSSDRLWVLDQDSGQLSWFDAVAHGRAPETFAVSATLVLVDGVPVVVDTVSSRVSLLAPDGGVRTQLEPGIVSEGGGADVHVTGSETQQTLLVTDSLRGIYESCDLVLDKCGEPQNAAFTGHTLGPAIAADGRVFVPDYSTGTVWVLDPGGTAAPVHAGPLVTVGAFDLFDRNGLIFYNDPHSASAGSIAADGTPRPITKYSTAAASGAPSASASPASPAPTKAGPTTAAPPTHATPTLPSSRPSGTKVGPTARPTPSPSTVPTGSGGGTPTCSSASPSSASLHLSSSSDQGGIVLSNSDPSSQNPVSGGGGRKPWTPTKTQIVGTVIAGVFGVVGLVSAAVVSSLFGLLTSHDQPPSSSPPPVTSTPSPAKQSQPSATASPLTPASGGSIPATPLLDVQDPGGTGVYGVVFTSSGTFATGDSNGSAYLWSVAQGASTAKLPDKSGQAIFGLAYGLHGNLLAADTSNAPHYTTGSVVLWDATTGRYIKTLLTPEAASVGSPVAFSPDGSTLAVSGDTGAIDLWSTASYQFEGALNTPSTKTNYKIAYSSKTGYLAAANGNGNAYLWNTQTKTIVTRFPDPDSRGIESIAFSPDGSLLATGDDNGNVYLWNVADGTLKATLPGLKNALIGDIAFSPRVGALAATVDDNTGNKYELCIWNTAGKLLATRVDSGSTGGTKVAFSPDGFLLAVGDTNDSTYVWDVSGLS